MYGAYKQREEYAVLLKRLTEAAFYRYEHNPLQKNVARALYGQVLQNSVSRLETYAACAYRHFLQYGMSLKEREELKFENVDMGNVFHGVLEGSLINWKRALIHGLIFRRSLRGEPWRRYCRFVRRSMGRRFCMITQGTSMPSDGWGGFWSGRC